MAGEGEVLPLLAVSHTERHCCLARGWRTYHGLLLEHPLLTKSVTASLMAATGEFVGSYLKKSGPGTPRERARRLGAFAVFGLVVNGPAFHFWYAFLEQLAQRWSKLTGGHHIILFKVIVDRLLMTPPYLVLTLVGLRWLQDFKLLLALQACALVYKSALLLNWKLWTVAQVINFNFVPLEYRVLFGNLVAAVWCAILSLLG
ncbi:hypothetical protein JKP88DRAFT_168858 [Tribonema minus]|uniref:Peroxisomal membrane protein 2 n=1 Tax=Tribonema minus TaxID=303371 RepID=A0A836CBT9_9STRA|nr:hypothetical protein JKP88DRAFT_168858 [Tribonema minus]